MRAWLEIPRERNPDVTWVAAPETTSLEVSAAGEARPTGKGGAAGRVGCKKGRPSRSSPKLPLVAFLLAKLRRPAKQPRTIPA